MMSRVGDTNLAVERLNDFGFVELNVAYSRFFGAGFLFGADQGCGSPTADRNKMNEMKRRWRSIRVQARQNYKKKKG